jgi:hypothetical protein
VTPPGPAAAQARLVEAWQQRLQAGAATVQRIETHASYVLLAGAAAYKLKKAVDLGFLDFRTLDQREHFCREELRLNRRTAPELYRAVRPLTGTADAPRLVGRGPVLDWVLCMRAFDPAGLWDRLASSGRLQPPQVDALADALAVLHRDAAVAAPDDPVGRAAAVRALLRDSLQVLQARCATPAEQVHLQALRDWEAEAFGRLQGLFDARAAAGFVREGHGDLHLGNITEHEGRTRMFDALEFDRALRFADVMSDVAFVAMDLRAHGLARLAHRFVDRYLAHRGDIDGLSVLRWYAVHRALVRAKVAALRAAQLGAGAPARAGEARSVEHYLERARAEGRAGTPRLLLTHGLPGSGKTLLTQSLLERLGAVRLRADIERKRLFGLAPLQRPDPALREPMYAAPANEATLRQLLERAQRVLRAGYPVILDATFGARAARQRALALADALGVPGLILDFRADAATLRARVARRAARADDASDAGVDELETLRRAAEPLDAAELRRCEPVDAERPFDDAEMPARWAPLLRRLGVPATA